MDITHTCPRSHTYLHTYFHMHPPCIPHTLHRPHTPLPTHHTHTLVYMGGPTHTQPTHTHMPARPLHTHICWTVCLHTLPGSFYTGQHALPHTQDTGCRAFPAFAAADWTYLLPTRQAHEGRLGSHHTAGPRSTFPPGPYLPQDWLTHLPLTLPFGPASFSCLHITPHWHRLCGQPCLRRTAGTCLPN